MSESNALKNDAYITVAVQNVTDLKGCRILYKAERFDIASGSAEARHLISVVLTECGDDFFKLWSVVTDTAGDYYVFISDAAFSKIVATCDKLEMLYLLCRYNLGDSDSLEANQRSIEIAEKMIAICGDDTGKICNLYNRFLEDRFASPEDKSIEGIITYLESKMNRFKTR
jgi:hypothetical protein